MASLVWNYLGDVGNYCEPFCGSAAVLLARPHPPRIETLNDADCQVANFWRATSQDPEAVAAWADAPVNECEMHAHHRWLVLSDEAKEFRQKMRTDPHYYDPKIAGWWCHGLCCWIGAGWCTEQGGTADGDRKECRPILTNKGEGQGIHASGRPQLADAYARGRGVHGNDAAGTCAQRRAWLTDWFSRLRDRLRTVRVCCGDWLRICDSESVTTRLGVTGIFFDPPYSTEAGRDMNLYASDCGKVAHAVRAYCLERGDNPRMRIVLCGYAGEGHEELEKHGWEVIAWRAQGGYGNRSQKGKDNARKERLWVSPHCLREKTLFDESEVLS